MTNGASFGGRRCAFPPYTRCHSETASNRQQRARIRLSLYGIAQTALAFLNSFKWWQWSSIDQFSTPPPGACGNRAGDSNRRW